MPKCSSCGTLIHWLKKATDDRAARPNPIDVAPNEAGNLVLDISHGLYRFATPDELLLARDTGKRLYISHFATCKQADKHRRKK